MIEGWKERESQGQGTVVSVETLWWKKADIKTSKPGKSDRARTKELPD